MRKLGPDNGSPGEVRLGSIRGSHGIQGWVKVFSYTDPKDAIFRYTPWILRRDDRQIQVEVVTGQTQGRRLVARIKGVEDRDRAEEMTGYDIYLCQDSFPSLEQGELYWFELEGLTVRNDKQIILGEVAHLLETGANDVLVVMPSPASVDDRQRLIPYVEQRVVKDVNRETGEILVAWEADY